ncbi:MAG: Fic family protein [Candidatus Adiutrix sp.]|nr:Fic family protein [Candidatus Adiutrix sp.]
MLYFSSKALFVCLRYAYALARLLRNFFGHYLLVGYRPINKNDKEKLTHKLAEILDTVNFLHPFREGNGRTQREFLRLLAKEKGWTLNLTPPDDTEVYERYMTGTVNADVDALATLISECLNM